jgi:acyl CoA:acetate/3-ketoacid CoA transferase beta subunit
VNPTDITPDEIMVYCISRQLRNGDVIVQGLATPLIAAAFLLARQTHAPNLYFASAIGQGIARTPAPLSLSRIEYLWVERNIKNISFASVAAEFLPWLRPKEFFRPAQIDINGNFNNIAFGKNFQTPRMRLPGTGGIPDMTVHSCNNYLYVPRHSKLIFPEIIDYCSGLGHNPSRRTGKGPKYLVTDLGQFNFTNGKMTLCTCHPGVSVNFIQSRTGFSFSVSPEIVDTPLPSDEILHKLRNEIDPLGIRRLEMLQGSTRRSLLNQILERENNH